MFSAIVNRVDFLNSVNAACVAIARRCPKAILACVRLDAADAVMRVSATDLENCIVAVVSQVEVQSAGVVVVNGENLAKLLKSSKDETLSLTEQADATISIKGQAMVAALPVYPVDEFPLTPTPACEDRITVNAAALRYMLQAALPHTAKEASRYSMNGIGLSHERAHLRAVATDGRRMAVIDTGVSDCTRDYTPPPCIMANETAKKLLKLVGKATERKNFGVDIHISPPLPATETSTERGIRLDISLLNDNHVRLIATTVEGEFPPYKDVIPSDCYEPIKLPRQELIDAIAQVNASADDYNGEPGIKLMFSRNLCEIHALHAKSAVNIYTGSSSMPFVVVGYYARFLLDFLKSVDTDEVSIELQQNATASRSSLWRAGADTQYVLMPISLPAEPAVELEPVPAEAAVEPVCIAVAV
jgi:DNA polymerase III subunit beta